MGAPYCPWLGPAGDWAGHVHGKNCEHSPGGRLYMSKCRGCSENMRPIALNHHIKVLRNPQTHCQTASVPKNVPNLHQVCPGMCSAVGCSEAARW
jgi:hypothetical protein